MIFWSRPASLHAFRSMRCKPLPLLSKWRSNRECVCKRSNAPLIYAHRQVFAPRNSSVIESNWLIRRECPPRNKEIHTARWWNVPRGEEGGKGLHYFVKIDNQFPCPRHSAHFHEINVPFTPLTVNVKTENTIILSIERVKLFQWGEDFRCVKYPHNIIFRIFHRRLFFHRQGKAHGSLVFYQDRVAVIINNSADA